MGYVLRMRMASFFTGAAAASFVAVPDRIGTVSLTYRIQADTYRESAATDAKFILTSIPVSIRLGTSLFQYEPAGTTHTGRYLEPWLQPTGYMVMN
ncbi:hypothetical protein ACSBR1_031897 [Camellia fascicularis]